MIAKLFAPLAMKIAGGIVGALLLALTVQTVRLSSADARNETLTAELALARAANLRMVEEGVARTERAKRSLEAAKRDAKPLQRDIERIGAEVPDGTCETPESVLQAGGL